MTIELREKVMADDFIFVVKLRNIPKVPLRGMPGHDAQVEKEHAERVEKMLRRQLQAVLSRDLPLRHPQVKPAMEAIEELLELALESPAAAVGRHRARIVTTPTPRGMEDVELPPS